MRTIRVLAPIINILPESSIIRYIASKSSEFLIFIANHLSNMDGIVLNKVLKKNNVTFMAGIKLNANPLTSIFLKTVKHISISPNSADRNAIKKALAVLSMGESILIFPEGTRSRSGSMINGKKGFLLLANSLRLILFQ